jgi:hypothetical protein
LADNVEVREVANDAYDAAHVEFSFFLFTLLTNRHPNNPG